VKGQAAPSSSRMWPPVNNRRETLLSPTVDFYRIGGSNPGFKDGIHQIEA
jgi:hypothetical protein